jgi:hypothetical protein
LKIWDFGPIGDKLQAQIDDLEFQTENYSLGKFCDFNLENHKTSQRITATTNETMIPRGNLSPRKLFSN